MTPLQALSAKQLRDINPLFGLGYPVATDMSTRLADSIKRARFAAVTTIAEYPLQDAAPPTHGDTLYTALARCKVKTNQFAMHFGSDWQRRFFAQLDALMSKDDWVESDTPVTEASFTTLMRLLLTMRGKRRPGLGLGNGGRVIAAWTNGADRLTIECLPDDRVRWIVSQSVDGESDAAAGDTTLALLPERLAPFNPDKWFADEGAKTPA
jgi:hypothetical protein